MGKIQGVVANYSGQQAALLRKFKINATHQGHPVLTVTGAAYDFGDGATRHRAIFDSIQNFTNGITHQGGMGWIDGLRFEPLPPSRSQGRPKKIARDVAMALAHKWFTCFFCTNDNLAPGAAKASAYGAVIDMWRDAYWPGAADENALKKNIKKGLNELRGLSCFKYLAPEESKSLVIAGAEKDFDLHPYKHMKFSGPAWVWRFGQERAQYGKISIPKTLLFPD